MTRSSAATPPRNPKDDPVRMLQHPREVANAVEATVSNTASTEVVENSSDAQPVESPKTNNLCEGTLEKVAGGAFNSYVEIKGEEQDSIS